MVTEVKRERVLLLAPHADDETLGAGGTLRKHVESGDHVAVAVATGRGPDSHPVIADSAFATVKAEARAAMEELGVPELYFLDMPAVLYPDQPIWRTNKTVHEVVERFRPTILYVPFLYDLHSDHRALFKAANVAWRPASDVGRGIRSVLAYEVQSETHWNPSYLEPGFLPTVWVSLTDEQVQAKLRALSRYKSQMYPFPHARSIEAVEHLMRWRGSQQGMAAAEGFVLIRSYA